MRHILFIIALLLIQAVIVQLKSLTNKNDYSNSSSFHWPGRVIAMGDIHSDGRNASMMLYKAGIIDEHGHWIAKDALLIQMGDIVDRGPDTKILYELFRQLRKEAEEQGGKVIQLLGNHEPMQICHMLHYVHPQDFDSYGGPSKRAFEFSHLGQTGVDIRNWDTAVVVNRTLFVHAGLTPQYATVGIEEVNYRIKNSLQNDCQNDILWGETSPLWNRIYSMGSIEDACSDLVKTLHILDVDRMIVGHTIQQGGVQLRCAGRLILADTGMSRFIQNQPTLVEFFNIGKDSTDETHKGYMHEYSLDYASAINSVSSAGSSKMADTEEGDVSQKNKAMDMINLNKRKLDVSIAETPFQAWQRKILPEQYREDDASTVSTIASDSYEVVNRDEL